MNKPKNKKIVQKHPPIVDTLPPIWGLKHWISVHNLEPVQYVFENKTYSDIHKIKAESVKGRSKYVIKRLELAVEDLKYKYHTINGVLFAKLETSAQISEATCRLCTCLPAVDAMIGPLSMQYTTVWNKVAKLIETVEPSFRQYECRSRLYGICIRVEKNPTFRDKEKQKFKEWKINIYKYNRV